MDDIQPREGGSPSATAVPDRGGFFGLLLSAMRRRVFHCPRCVNHVLRRSRPRGWEFWLGLFLLRAYRCHGCFRRYWRPRIRI
jgi:hypothetical protein